MSVKKKNTIIYLLTALMIMLAVFVESQSGRKDKPFYFEASMGEHVEQFRFWQDEDGNCFVFLPGHVELPELRIRTHKSVLFDDLKLTDGMNCEKILLDQPYALTGDPEEKKTITFMKSRGLPSIHIETASKSMEYIHETKGNQEMGEMRLYDAEGRVQYAGSLESIESRGNSTFYLPKKPYNLELKAQTDLLGMGAASKWILLADSTNLNNKLAYDFAAAAGLPYSPQSRWVDLYLNREYAGLYLLCERNEIHPQRVDLSRDEGILVSQERLDVLQQKEKPYFVTNEGVPLRVHAAPFGIDQVQSIFQSAENAILAEDGVDPWTGKHWTELIDIHSWVRKYLMEEIFYGVDSAVASQFFFYQGDGTEGRIYAGPVWDYDDTMHDLWIGGEDLITYPKIFYAHRSRDCPWYEKLYYDNEFSNLLTEVYEKEISGLLQYFAEEKLPEYSALISQSYRMSKIRWSNSELEGKVNRLQSLITQRRAFLDDVWIRKRPYAEVDVDFTNSEYSFINIALHYAVTPGECMPELPDVEPYSWFIKGTQTPFDMTQPIYENTAIELRQNTGKKEWTN